MSLPEPPFTVEEIQALSADAQRLIKKIIDYYEQVVGDLKARLDDGRKTPRNSSLPPSSEHPHAKPAIPAGPTNGLIYGSRGAGVRDSAV